MFTLYTRESYWNNNDVIEIIIKILLNFLKGHISFSNEIYFPSSQLRILKNIPVKI